MNLEKYTPEYKLKQFAEKYNIVDIEKYTTVLNNVDELHSEHGNKKLTKDEEKLLCIDLLDLKDYDELATKYSISIGTVLLIKSKYKISKRERAFSSRECIPVNIDFFENLNEEKPIYWAGFILGDGCISKNDKNGGAKLVIGLSRNDKSHLEKFADDIDYGGEIKDSSVYHKQRDKYDEKTIIRIHRLKICDDLIKHGITQNKSKECHLPKTIPDELMYHFIRGLVDADGCWYVNAKKNMRFLLTCSVYEFLVELRAYFANKLGLNPDIKINAKKGCWYLEYAGNKQCKSIYFYLYNKSSVFLDRKYSICKNHFEKPEVL